MTTRALRSLRRWVARLCGCIVLLAADARAATVYVKPPSGVLKREPSALSATVQQLAAGEALTLLEPSGEWVRVRTAGGSEGYVYSGRIAAERPTVAPAPSADPLGDLFGGVRGGGATVREADTAASIRGLTPVAKQYAQRKQIAAETVARLEWAESVQPTAEELAAFRRALAGEQTQPVGAERSDRRRRRGDSERTFSSIDEWLLGPRRVPEPASSVGGSAGSATAASASSSGAGSAPAGREGSILSGTAQAAQAAFLPMSEAEERSLGGTVALEAAQRFGGIYQDEALQRYLATAARVVADASDRPALAYAVVVLDSAEINAFAVPGGYVFVSRGMLATIRDEAELAGALAHEIAHIAKRHALEIIQKTRLASGLAQTAFALADADPAELDSLVAFSTDLVFNRGLGRELEGEADKLALTYAQRAGYPPQAFADLIARLAERARRAPRELEMLSTHPDPGERAERVARLAAEQYAASASRPRLESRWAARGWPAAAAR